MSAKGEPTKFAFIIGAMKSGTTSVFDILGQHPQICCARIKEPDYFSNCGQIPNVKEYLSLWNWDDDSHKIALEASVSYAKAPFIPGVPRRIFEAKLGECRFIYILRDPIRRIESQVRHGIFAGWGKSLDNGISEDLIEFSRYAMQLDNYLEFFDRSQICVLLLEEFQQHPEFCLKRLCEFLGLDVGFHFKDFERPRNVGDFFNAHPVVASLTQGKSSQKIAALMPSRVKNQLRNLISSFSRKDPGVSEERRWKLTPEEKAGVLGELEKDLGRLKVEYGLEIKKFWNLNLAGLDLPK